LLPGRRPDRRCHRPRRIESIGVGIGLLPAAVRNPAIAAMELATLASLHPGRFRAAFGHGVPAWMRQIGAAPQRRLTVLRETVESVRALLHGEELDRDGELFELRQVALDQPPPAPPEVLIGSTGPRGSWTRIDDDGERARAELIPTVEAWRDSGLYAVQMAHGGLSPDSPVDAEAVARVSIAGDPEQCTDALARLAEAGAATVLVRPVGPRPVEQVERFAAEVMPSFNAVR
jgi:alkanesulfonate monooxygenase SsuD/methylene tetrahydromethanopterin reductase-like flavin-dependent oxidoreductase (luciferase family)